MKKLLLSIAIIVSYHQVNAQVCKETPPAEPWYKEGLIPPESPNPSPTPVYPTQPLQRVQTQNYDLSYHNVLNVVDGTSTDKYHSIYGKGWKEPIQKVLHRGRSP